MRLSWLRLLKQSHTDTAQVEPPTRVSGCMDSDMAAAICSSKMELAMKALGIWAEPTDTVNLLTFKVRLMRVNGQMTCTMARVCLLT